MCCVLRLLFVDLGLLLAVFGVRCCLLRVVCWCCLFFVSLLLSVALLYLSLCFFSFLCVSWYVVCCLLFDDVCRVFAVVG